MPAFAMLAFTLLLVPPKTRLNVLTDG